MDDLHIEYESTPAAWCAYFDPEGYIGRGKTREEAITELLEYAYEAWGAAVDERNAAKRSLSDSVTRADSLAHKLERDAVLLSAETKARIELERALAEEQTRSRVAHLLGDEWAQKHGEMRRETDDLRSALRESNIAYRDSVHYAEKLKDAADERMVTLLMDAAFALSKVQPKNMLAGTLERAAAKLREAHKVVHLSIPSAEAK